METTQKRWISKVVRSGIIGSIVSILSLLWIATVDDALKSQILEIISAGILIATSVMAIVGRFSAKKTIEPVLPTPPTV
jgi:hypothetical protein